MTTQSAGVLVTVGVAVYNHALYVGECLRSVARQDHPAIELVIIDDGSSDNSVDEIKQFLGEAEGRFTRVVFRHRENRGLVSTMQEIVDASTAPLFVPLASDDVLLPFSVRRRAELLLLRPEKLAVMTDCTVIDEAGSERLSSGIRDLHGGNLNALRFERGLAFALMLKWCVPGPCISLRREALDPERGIGPYSDLAFPEDFDLYMRLASRRQLWFVPEQTALYRVHDSNISRSEPDLMHRGQRSAIQQLQPSLPPLERGLARLILVATGEAGGKRWLARATLWLLRRSWPATLGFLMRWRVDQAQMGHQS